MRNHWTSIAVFSAAFMSALMCTAMDVHATNPPLSKKSTPAALLNRAYEIKTKDYAEFQHTLSLLHHRRGQLTEGQQWQLRYLDAWQIAFGGNYAESNRILHDIIADSGNPSVSGQASALLIYTLNAGQHYEASYKLASTLISDLPRIKDQRTRTAILTQVSQMLALAGQRKLALKYARQLETELPTGTNKCKAYALEIGVQSDSNKVHSSDPALERAIDSCLAAKRIVYANVLRIDMANMLIKEGHPHQAIHLLRRIAPSIRKSGYQRHLVELHALLAKAYLRQNEDANARKSALAALSSKHAGNFIEDARVAYGVLYHVDKRAGSYASALAYHEKYVTLDQASKNEAKARALAYQMVRQNVLASKLKVEKLGKQNKILQLRQSLHRKAAENSRLYIVLLLVVLASIAFWAYRTKHSQLRFREMARHDDLTAAFNRQHFFEQARRTLERLHKSQTDACLLVLDMDHFKRVNDSHGHVAGDGVLKHAAVIFREQLRAVDVFGRLGGEEFGILMPCSRTQGIEIGQRICRALAATPARLDHETTITVTASIGLACSDVSGHVLRKLLVDADTALYGAKRSGRNQLVGNNGKHTQAVI